MLLLALLSISLSFVSHQPTRPGRLPNSPRFACTTRATRRCAPPQLNVLDDVKQVVDGVKDAYEDDEYCPEGYVRASHILFLATAGDAEQKAEALKARLAAGEFTFAQAALAFSSCPTRDLDGKLGVFQSLSKLTEGTLRGDSMPYDGADTSAFDALLFSASLNVVHQVDTQWGTHLVLIEERGDGAPADLLAKSLEVGVDKAANLVSQAVGAAPETSAGAAGRAPSGGFRVGAAPGGSKAKRQRSRKKRK